MIDTAVHSLEGLNAVVTGAAQGLGLGIAEELGRRGARVVMADVQGEKVERAAARLEEKGLSVEAACLDIADSRAVREFFKEFAGSRGRLDILVNNAGSRQRVTEVAELSDREWDNVLRVTLTGTFYCCRSAAAAMQQQESGVIVNIASVNGQSPAALVAAYNAAKAGVISLSRTLALELAPYGVRVNAVSPGPVYTDFNKQVMAERARTLDVSEEEMVQRVAKSIPLGRWGEADEIAQGVAFLCSPAATWITGEVLRISGGLEGVSATPPKKVKAPGDSK
jgi:NAD(P)-dependent dehydrogenase (short-subunit alcohol dehydrogenase family)